MGEYLAEFFGITTPKYQFEIDEYYRIRAAEEDMLRKEDLEMGGWTERNKNNLISKNEVTKFFIIFTETEPGLLLKSGFKVR